VLTDSAGLAGLTTIHPGWYRGRCIHIHVKVHTGATLTSDGSFEGDQDGIYDDGGASSGLLTLTAPGSSPAAGYRATLTLGVDRF
jgi:protocatechuate 3,4-dioxygenase beta subunit